MLHNFEEYLSESLNLGRAKKGTPHYIERINLRIQHLKISDFINISSKSNSTVNFPKGVMNEIESFFRQALFMMVDPKISKIFSDTTIDHNKFGIIRVAKPKILLDNNIVLEPIFKVKGKGAEWRKGKYFWIFTDSNTVTTIKLYNVNGEDDPGRKFLMQNAYSHVENERIDSLNAKLSHYDIGVAPSDLFTIVTDPIGEPDIVLDLRSGAGSIEEQLKSLGDIVTNEIVDDPGSIRMSRFEDFEAEELENVPKQMALLPGKVWYMDYNEKFGKWGAYPIEDAVIMKDKSKGNSINLKCGPKHIYWIEGKSGLFAPPKNIIINKGDAINLAKQVGDRWVKFNGIVTDISTDLRHTKYPYVKTEGWKTVTPIDPSEYDDIFKLKEPIQVSESKLLDFGKWNTLKKPE